MLVTTTVYLTLTQSGEENVLMQGCVSVPPASQVWSPSVGSRNATSVHNGDPGPLLPVLLSGLEASRQRGLHTRRFVSGVLLQEQLICITSYVPLMVTFKV